MSDDDYRYDTFAGVLGDGRALRIEIETETVNGDVTVTARLGDGVDSELIRLSPIPNEDDEEDDEDDGERECADCAETFNLAEGGEDFNAEAGGPVCARCEDNWP